MRKKTIDRFYIVEIIIILLCTNYMVGTIILKDIAPVKYLRDILLVLLLSLNAFSGNSKVNKRVLPFMALLPFMVIGILKAPSIGGGIVVLRRYIFPIGLLVALSVTRKKYNIRRVGKFVLYFFSTLAIFGVFQAYVLGDSFLRRLGYPVVYSYGYKRDMLFNSFYFGGFGIQRVVATFSSSNICGLAFGTTILFIVFMCPYIRFGKKEKLLFSFLIVGYLLTVSRSNFLAMIVVAVLLIWPYIPSKTKKWIPAGLVAIIIVLVAIGVAQGTSGIVYRMYKWVLASLNFSEDSAAGRSGIWKAAFEQVLKSPLGIGFGHVGGMADSLGIIDTKFSSENSYLAIGLDMGWFALILYVTIFVSYYRHFKSSSDKYPKNSIQQRYYKFCSVLVMYVMIVMFFSNHIHDMEVISIMFLYIGIGLSDFGLAYYYPGIAKYKGYKMSNKVRTGVNLNVYQ